LQHLNLQKIKIYKSILKNKKIIIFTEYGNNTKGSGHFYRVLNLLLNLKKFKVEIYIKKIRKFADLTKNFKLKFQFYNLKSKNFIKNYSDEYLIILDVYNPSLLVNKFDNLLNKKIIIFNDLNFISSNKHILINPQKIQNSNKRNLFEGLNYFPIKKNFKEIRYKYRIRQKVKKIFVFLGSFPSKKNIIKMQIFLNKYVDKSIQIDFYVNYDFKDVGNISFKKIDIDYYKFINKYDIAFISGGFIKFELLYLGMPVAYFTIEKHQLNLAKYFTKNRLGYFINNINSNDFYNKKSISFLSKIIQSYNFRKKMFNYSRKKIDGYGIQRILDIIKKI